MHGSIINITRHSLDRDAFDLITEMTWGPVYATTLPSDVLEAMLGVEAFAPIDDNDGGRIRLQVIHEGEAGFDPVDIISEREAAVVKEQTV